MKKVILETVLSVYESLEELDRNAAVLMQQAIIARSRSYSPYSKFSVGTAIRLENGEIITGSNQENASYPSGLCAERTAIYYAGSQFPNTKIISMAITAGAKDKKTDNPIPPCGACRQAIAEYEVKQGSPIEIYFMGEIGKVAKSDSLANMLPLIFDKSAL
jgi:cytidine deaminase